MFEIHLYLVITSLLIAVTLSLFSLSFISFKFANYLVEINKGETGTKISSIAGAPATPKK
jgi:hypothetical protein